MRCKPEDDGKKEVAEIAFGAASQAPCPTSMLAMKDRVRSVIPRRHYNADVGISTIKVLMQINQQIESYKSTQFGFI